MASKQISSFGATTTLADGDEFHVNQTDNIDRKITKGDLATSILAGIEAGATADQTDVEIKAAYEANADTNVYDDSAVSKLAGIEDGATADQTKTDIDALGISAVSITGALPAIDGSALTGITSATLNGLDAANLKSGRKNIILNGDFDHWQRGTSQTSTSGYGSDDRWRNHNTGTTKTASRQPFALGQTDVPNNPTYYSRTVVSSVAGSSNNCLKQQRIEGVATLSGQTVTFSFYAKSDSPKNIATEFAQAFGTGGSPSTVVQGVGVTTHNLTTSWQKFTTTVTLPSVSGKTLGTNGNDYLRIYFWLDAGSGLDARTNSLGQQSGTFDIAQVQLEEGSIATNFEHRSVGEEMALCQRYYQRSIDGHSGSSYLFSGDVATGATYYFSLRFPVVMRATPTLVLTNRAAFMFSTTPGTPVVAYDGFREGRSCIATGASGYYSSNWTADAEL